jgi:hypothetical protein
MDPGLSASVAQLSRTLVRADELVFFHADPISGPYGIRRFGTAEGVIGTKVVGEIF